MFESFVSPFSYFNNKGVSGSISVLDRGWVDSGEGGVVVYPILYIRGMIYQGVESQVAI